MDQPGVVEVKVSECVLDMALYPRHCVDQGNVQSLREALRAEAKFPPIVLERKTMRIVDGASRLTATREEQGDEALIRAYLRDYPSEAALLSEAIQLNASHGRRLTTYDRARCIQLARELGLTDAEVAKSLRITVEKVEQIVNTRFTMGPDDKVVPIKLTSAPVLAGRQATPHQLVANKGAGGDASRLLCQPTAERDWRRACGLVQRRSRRPPPSAARRPRRRAGWPRRAEGSLAKPGEAGRGEVRLGFPLQQSCSARQGGAGQSRAGSGPARFGKAWLIRFFSARPGAEWHGAARRGAAACGTVGKGLARTHFLGAGHG
jgi:hypothetical protein